MVATASRDFYADTSLMALICRHDRALWVATLTSPGEKQHDALALLQQLFENLANDWTVGLLYDITCQIERSVAGGFLLV
jgi:Kyakuja-Dileera-Zisupton transposase